MSNLTLKIQLLEQRLDLLENDVDLIKADIDAFLLILMGMIVFLMQAGFAFFEAGSVRFKNVTNILLKNYLDVSVGGIVYWLVGYAFSYGKYPSGFGDNSFIGFGNFLGSGDKDTAFWFFQFVFAATSATIVSGAMAERTNFSAYIIYSSVMTGFIYPVVCHWAWDSRGWLARLDPPYMDFAGSGVIHVLGGSSALMGAMFLGARIGRFKDGKVRILQPSSTFLTALGGMLLWFGFFAFNAGSELKLSNGSGQTLGRVLISTILGSCSGSLTAFLLGKIITGKYQLVPTIAGNLAGMVSICASANTIGSGSAVIIGCIGALIDRGIMEALLYLKIDDPLDAVGVHLGAGSWGVLAAGFFNKNTGLFYGGGFRQLGSNTIALGIIILWSSTCCIVVFGSLRLLKAIRVSPDAERIGLDHTEHHEIAFALHYSTDSFTA